MRIHLVRLGLALSCTLAAIALLGLAVFGMRSTGQTGQLESTANQARPAAAERNWDAPSQRGDFLLISDRMAPVGARRTISDPGLNTPLTISETGRKIMVTGHVACVKGDEYKVQTSVTQSSTAALGRGETPGTCTGKEEQFAVATWAYDEALFAAGPAQACALLTIRTRGKMSDVFQWCRKDGVTLTRATASY